VVLGPHAHETGAVGRKWDHGTSGSTPSRLCATPSRERLLREPSALKVASWHRPGQGTRSPRPHQITVRSPKIENGARHRAPSVDRSAPEHRERALGNGPGSVRRRGRLGRRRTGGAWRDGAGRGIGRRRSGQASGERRLGRRRRARPRATAFRGRIAETLRATAPGGDRQQIFTEIPAPARGSLTGLGEFDNYR
jgi:hypothetical protein